MDQNNNNNNYSELDTWSSSSDTNAYASSYGSSLYKDSGSSAGSSCYSGYASSECSGTGYEADLESNASYK